MQQVQQKTRGWIVEAWHPDEPKEPVAITPVDAVTIDEAHKKVMALVNQTNFDGAIVIHAIN